MLADGGNAVDACVAAAAVAWVAESPLTGPGAGGFMLVHRARDATDRLLDFFVEVPGRGPRRPAGELDTVDVPFGSGDTTQRFLVGPASCAVPGMVAGLAVAHRRYGTLPWHRLLEPAIALAAAGVELTPSQAFLHEILDAVLRREAAGRAIYGDRCPRAGDRIVMRDLSRTLETLAADGADAFYRGDIGAAIAAALADRGGLVTADDLASYRVVSRRPVRVPYRGRTFVSNPPPSSGGVLVAFSLRLLDRLGAGGVLGSVEAISRLADVAREASRARRRRAVDRRLLTEARVEAALARLRGGASSTRAEPRGLPSTTHVSVVDARGNAASLSSSTGCGSGVVVPGTGIQLNNMLGETDLNPSGAPLQPGERLTSMMAPSLVLHAGRPRLVLGSAGSERLRGAILQTVVNVVDHGLDLREAIDRPRVHLDGSDLHLEGGFDERVASRLEQRGYSVVRWPGAEPNLYFGGVAAVGLDAGGRLEAAGDPRRGGHGIVVS